MWYPDAVIRLVIQKEGFNPSNAVRVDVGLPYMFINTTDHWFYWVSEYLILGQLPTGQMPNSGFPGTFYACQAIETKLYLLKFGVWPLEETWAPLFLGYVRNLA